MGAKVDYAKVVELLADAVSALNCARATRDATVRGGVPADGADGVVCGKAAAKAADAAADHASGATTLLGETRAWESAVDVRALDASGGFDPSELHALIRREGELAMASVYASVLERARLS